MRNDSTKIILGCPAGIMVFEPRRTFACLWLVRVSIGHLPRIAVLTAIIYYTFESGRGKRNNPKISKLRFFTYWMGKGWKRMESVAVKSCGVLLFLRLLSFSLSISIIENVDDLIFCDISIFPLVKGESKKLWDFVYTWDLFFLKFLEFPLSEWFNLNFSFSLIHIFQSKEIGKIKQV